MEESFTYLVATTWFLRHIILKAIASRAVKLTKRFIFKLRGLVLQTNISALNLPNITFHYAQSGKESVPCIYTVACGISEALEPRLVPSCQSLSRFL